MAFFDVETTNVPGSRSPLGLQTTICHPTLIVFYFENSVKPGAYTLWFTLSIALHILLSSYVGVFSKVVFHDGALKYNLNDIYHENMINYPYLQNLNLECFWKHTPMTIVPEKLNVGSCAMTNFLTFIKNGNFKNYKILSFNGSKFGNVFFHSFFLHKKL